MRTLPLAILAALVFAASTAADTITVCLDGSCDYTDIQEAINAASDGDVIEIAAETYYPPATIDTLGKAVTLLGVLDADGEHATVLDGSNQRRVIGCTSGETNKTVFQNLLIRNGRAGTDGGGMYLYGGSSPCLVNCMFVGNLAVYSGGGIYSFDSSPVLCDCVFDGNQAFGQFGWGGAVLFHGGEPRVENCSFSGNSANYGGGAYNLNSRPEFTGCEFSNNTAVGLGGGMYNRHKSAPVLTECVFEANSAERGGGICNTSQSDPVLEECVFNTNTAGSGGGVAFEDGSNAVLVDCEFQSNRATTELPGSGFGGGMSCVGGTASLAGCAFTENYSGFDGGGGLYFSASGNTSIVDCVFRENTASNGRGGGMLCIDVEDSNIEGCTFIANYANTGGGGVFEASHFLFVDCLFQENATSNDCGGLYCLESDGDLNNCQFTANTANSVGGALVCAGSNPELQACSFSQNSALVTAGDLYYSSDSLPMIADSSFAECCSITPVVGYVDNGGNSITCKDCRADVDCNGIIDAADLGLVLSAWGSIQAQYDINGDGLVAGGDIGLLLGTWGVCQ